MDNEPVSSIETPFVAIESAVVGIETPEDVAIHYQHPETSMY